MQIIASTMYLSVAFFLVLTESRSCFVDANFNQYVPLISDVRNHYSSSSVFFVFSPNNSQMQEYTLAHLLSRTFSEQNVFTLVTHFDELEERLDYYQQRIGQPLVVILLRSFDDVDEFNRSICGRNKSFPRWLVIFHGLSGNSFCDYCRRPVKNMFGLRLDTLMLVVCCNDPMLREWWSVNGNITEVDNLATWTLNERLRFLATNGLNARRHDVHGTGLRVVIVTTSPLVYDHGESVGGFFGIILDELQRAMNFTITQMIPVKGYGSYDNTTKKWSGAVGLLAEGKADLAVADLTMSDARLDVVEFTYPLFLSRTELYIREPDSKGMHWFAYFEVGWPLNLGYDIAGALLRVAAFASEIWIIVIALIIKTPFLLALIKTRKGWKSFGTLSIDNYLHVWGIFCQQGLFEFPKETPMRIAYYSISVSALVVYGAYSASLISFLTVRSSTLPFTDLVGFVEDGSYELIVYQKSSHYDFFYFASLFHLLTEYSAALESSINPIFEIMRTLMKPWRDLPPDPTTAWDQVCGERVALIANDVQRRFSNRTCEIMAIDTGRVDSLAMALPAGSQYTNVVNWHIQRFMANGIIMRLRALFHNKEISTETTYDVVQFSRVAPILLILAGGIVLAIIILLCETIYHSYKNHQHRRSLNIKSRRTGMRESFNCGRRPQLSRKIHLLRPRFRDRKFGAPFFGYYP